MSHHRCSTPLSIAVDGLGLPERLAIWALRCIDHPPRTCHAPRRAAASGVVGELLAVTGQLQAFQMQMHRAGGAGLRIAGWGTLHLSRDERRLLRAVAAFQAGQTELADNLLFRFAPRPVVRAGLAQALAALAATLAAGGYWLPQPAEAERALPLARLIGVAAASAAVSA